MGHPATLKKTAVKLTRLKYTESVRLHCSYDGIICRLTDDLLICEHAFDTFW